MNWYCAILDALHLPLRQRGPTDPYHLVLPQFQQLVAGMPSPVVVEVGSRNVSGVTRRHLFPTASRYVGVDVHAGEGVDVVGDAHQLSRHFEAASVDAVFSISVFEHLVFPWKVVLELNRILKHGGYVMVATHPAWPAHELPWDFWRFPVAGLAHLFIPDTGFELVTATEGLPCKPYSLVDDPPTRPFFRFKLNMGVAVIARKIGDYDAERLRWDVDVGKTVKSEYPKPRAKS